MISPSIKENFHVAACLRARCSPNGGCRADLLPAGYQQTHRGDTEDAQQREACGVQHLSVLLKGQDQQSERKPDHQVCKKG